MSAIDALLFGLKVVCTFHNLFAALVGAFAGTAIGVLPGLGPAAGIALIIPITYSFSPVTALIMMAGMYYGAMYGGSTTAILINMPGETASVMTTIDGYKLTQKGRAGGALFNVALGSFVGGTVSVVGVMLFAPPLAEVALMFGPAEFFAMLLGGLLVFSRISARTLAAGLFPMAIGLVLGTIGQEDVTARNRFTFGIIELTQGIELVALVVGLYGVAEIMRVIESPGELGKPIKIKVRDMLPTRTELRRSWAPMGRGTLIGFFFGLIPGPHATLSSFASYRIEKAVSKYRHEIGQGAIEGVVGPETANNAGATAAMVPLLSFGVPFGAVVSIMLAAMMSYGIQPGPLLITDHPDVFYGVIVSMYLGNIMLVIINIPLIGVWVSLLRVPKYIFLPLILMVAVIGSYSVNNSMLDLYVLLLLSVIGYLFQKFDFELAPLVIGFVIGPLIEKHMREGLFLSQGDISIFFSSPIAVMMWIFVLIVMFLGIFRPLLKRLLAKKKKQ